MMRWLAYLCVSLPVNALAILLAPILPLFADKAGWLPAWLWWFETPDNSLDGDHGWKTEHLVGWPRYVKRVMWLWRNPAYAFEIDVLGARFNLDDPVLWMGDPWIRNRAHARAGSLLVTIGDYWCWKRIEHLFGDRCLMMEFGWKLQPYAQDFGNCALMPRAQFVCSVRLTSFYPDAAAG